MTAAPAPPSADGGRRAWAVGAAAAVATVEALVLIGVLFTRESRAAPLYAVLLAVKLPFCAALMDRSAGAWLALLLYEGTGVFAAVLAPDVPLVLRLVELALASGAVALLIAALPAMPRMDRMEAARPMSPMTRTRRRVVYGVLLTIAFGCLIAAILLSADPEDIQRPTGVVAVSPVENATEVRQATIFAEVDADYEAVLFINRTEIPKDQLDFLQTGNLRVSYTPGQDKEFERFPSGRNCARVVFWPIGQDRATTSRDYGWCFTLQ